ncbi:MAG: hypothetical protein ABIY55_06415 [Kofleriaceae bacterium]
MSKGILVLAFCVAACNTNSAERAESRFAFHITETATRLEITAVDATELRGEVVLENGRFEIPEMDGDTADGRRLTVKLGRLSVEHVSAGYSNLHLPLLSGGAQGLNSLLTAPEVAEPLARRGVWLSTEMLTGPTGVDPPALSGAEETPYSCLSFSSGSSSPFTGCGPCTYATTAACGPASCNQFRGAGGEAQQFVVCQGAGAIAQRACTTPMGNTSCGHAGPNGCAVCWTIGVANTATVANSGGVCTWTNCCQPLACGSNEILCGSLSGCQLFCYSRDWTPDPGCPVQ